MSLYTVTLKVVAKKAIELLEDYKVTLFANSVSEARIKALESAFEQGLEPKEVVSALAYF